MRWVAIIFVLAAIVATGWFVARLSPAQPFLRVPVTAAPSESDTPADPDGGVETTSSEAPVAIAPQDDVTPPETPSNELLTATDPEPAPIVPVPVLEGEAALAQYRIWISEARAAHPYADGEQRMYDVMMCESGGQADIVNPAGPYTGLFQYADGTWNGDWNTYRDSVITEARAQIFATALAWSLDMQSQWGCYTRRH